MSHIRRVILLVMSGACAVASTASAEPATRPAGGDKSPVQEQALAEVRRVMGSKAVTLSTADAATPDRYHFLVRVALPAEGGGTTATEFLIERDGDDVAVLVRSAGGLPYAYATNGLFVGFDPTARGRLVVYAGGSPTFTYDAGPGGAGLVFELSFVKDAARPSIVLDPRSLLAAALPKVVQATLEPGRRTVELTTTKATVTVVAAPPEKAAAFAVERLTTTTTATGATISVTDIHVEPKLCVNVLGVTRESVRRLGLPVRELADADRRALLLVPPDFGKDEKERIAAEKLATLFSLGPPSTSRPGKVTQ
jgi:hypothetical protein